MLLWINVSLEYEYTAIIKFGLVIEHAQYIRFILLSYFFLLRWDLF